MDFNVNRGHLLGMGGGDHAVEHEIPDEVGQRSVLSGSSLLQPPLHRFVDPESDRCCAHVTVIVGHSGKEVDPHIAGFLAAPGNPRW